MRRLITLFIIVISALFFMNINASTIYKNVPDFSNNYLKRFNSYTRYFVTTDAPYGYEIDEIKNDSNYKLGGLLNKDEFLNSMDSNGNTYLFNGLEYWTMTKSDSSKMMVIDPKSTSKISNFPYDRSSGIRNTEYVQNGTYLNGSGTYTDPWTFVKKHYVTFVYDDTKIAINPRVAFAPYNGAITVRVTDGNAYVYSSNDCGAELTIENKLKLENIKKDITCNISTALAYHTITYNPEGYCTPNTKTIKHGKEIGEMCAPIKTGYTFKGWYDEETGGTKVTKKTKLMEDMDLYAKFEANEFIVNYIGNNNTSGETTNQTCTYDEECNLKVNGFMRTGYTFNGWNTKADGTGTLYAERDSIKNIVSQGTKKFYAMWKANPIVLAASTSTVSYSTSGQTKNNFVSEATGGTGSYSYTIIGGNDSAYFTLSGRDLTIKAATPAETYRITIKATDNNSGSTTEGIMTLVINKIDPTCPTLTAYSGVFDGNPHTISISGGVGGTIQYSTDNVSWSTTKPTRTDVGEITVYVKRASSNNYNEKSCGSAKVTITQASATCPTLTTYSGDFDEKDHSITVSGGANGTIQYRTATSGDGSTWTTTNPTRTAAGTTTVYVRVEASGNYKTISCGNAKIKINKVAATLTCSNKTYNGAEQTACSCNGGTVDGEYKATNYSSTAYTASCTPDGNHTTPSNKTWTMSKKPITITAKAQTVSYGTAISNSTSDVTVDTLVSGHSLTAITLTPSTSNYTTSGTITPKSATIKKGSTDVTSNYSISYATGTLKINKVAATLTCSNKTYNGAEQTACSCSGGTVDGEYKATNYRSTAYSASCTPDGNHTTPSNKTWTMSKKPITITAKAQTINYGTSISNSTSDVTVDTLVSGHSLTAITLTPSTSNCTTNGTITPSAATIKKGSTDLTSNYSISYATGTLKIDKVLATCPTLTRYKEDYDGQPHSIIVSGGSGGTIQYSTDNETWSTTNPTLTDVGVLQVYVRVVGDSNHKTVTCGYAYLSVEPLEATCPTKIPYCGIYDGQPHTITIIGGSGGTIYYRASEDGGQTWTDWSTTLPTRTEIGQTIVQVKILGDKNYHPSKGCTSANIDVRSKYLPCEG